MSVRTAMRRMAATAAAGWLALAAAGRAEPVTNTLAAATRYAAALAPLAAAVQADSTNAVTTNLLAELIAAGEAFGDALDAALDRIEAAGSTGEATAAMEAAADAARAAEESVTWVRVGLPAWVLAASEQSVYLEAVAASLTNSVGAAQAVDAVLAELRNVAVPPYLALHLRASPRAAAGESVAVAATVRNAGDQAAGKVKVMMTYGENPDLTRQRITLGEIAPGAAVRHVFNIPAPAVRVLAISVQADGWNCQGDAASVTVEVEGR